MTFREIWEKLTDALVYGFITGGFIPTKETKMSNENTKPEPKDSEISNRERHERDCRLSCLAHSVDVARITQDHDEIINRAKLYYDFVKEGK